MNVGIILAGGIGSRVGAKIPKQFIEIYGKPIIAYTIEIYQNHPEIDEIEIVCVKSHIETLKQIISKYKYDKVKWIVEGGVDFQHSVINGIFNLKNYLSSDDVVLVHYGVAPLTTPDIISDSIAISRKKGNSVSATPCYLLLGTNDGGESKMWIDRDKVMQLNGPQGFKYEYIYNLYKQAIEKGYIEKVEPHTTSLMYYMG